MTIVLHFEASETCVGAHGTNPERVSIPFDTSDGTWVQLTYESIRTQDGAFIAELDEESGCWTLLDRDGFYSDVVIEFVASAQP